MLARHYSWSIHGVFMCCRAHGARSQRTVVFIQFPVDVAALMSQTTELMNRSHKAIYILLHGFSIQSACSFYSYTSYVR